MGVFDVAITQKGKGLASLQTMLKRLGSGGLRMARFELTRQSALTLGLASQKAPRDTSLLRINVRVIPAKIIRNMRGPLGSVLPSFIRAGFVFLQNYAEVQHENLIYRHEEGESRYAFKALQQRQQAIFGGVMRALRRMYSRL